MTRSARALPHGFTLVEVLVALAILALVSSFVFDGLSGSLSWQGRAQHEEAAASLAETTLNRVGGDILLRNGRQSGEAVGGYAWQVDIGDYDDDQTTTGARVSAHLIEVAVTWTDDRVPRHFRLQSVRLGPAGVFP